MIIVLKMCWNSTLTDFSSTFHFFTPENVRKANVFWSFHGGMEMEYLAKMG